MYIQRNKKMDQCFQVLDTWGILRVGPLPKNFIEYPSMRDNIPCNSKYLCVSIFTWPDCYPGSFDFLLHLLALWQLSWHGWHFGLKVHQNCLGTLYCLPHTQDCRLLYYEYRLYWQFYLLVQLLHYLPCHLQFWNFFGICGSAHLLRECCIFSVWRNLSPHTCNRHSSEKSKNHNFCDNIKKPTKRIRKKKKKVV